MADFATEGLVRPATTTNNKIMILISSTRLETDNNSVTGSPELHHLHPSIDITPVIQTVVIQIKPLIAVRSLLHLGHISIYSHSP